MRGPTGSGIPIVVVAVLLVAAGACEPASSSRTVEGAWRVIGLEFTTPVGSSVNDSPLPGQAIFFDGSYSLVWMPGDTAMRAFDTRWEPTDAEKIERYGQIIMNSGTYVVEGDSLMTLWPIVSRVPEFMGGGRLIYKYRVLGDTLWFTSLDEYSYDGVQAPWAAAGNRVTLTLVRAK
jgi:hypothetical protein